MLAQSQGAKQQFYKNSKWKRLTQVEIENRLFSNLIWHGSDIITEYASKKHFLEFSFQEYK